MIFRLFLFLVASLIRPSGICSGFFGRLASLRVSLHISCVYDAFPLCVVFTRSFSIFCLANGWWPTQVRQFAEKTDFFIVGSSVMFQMVFLFGGALGGLEVGDVEESLADCFQKCERRCVCQCGSVTPLYHSCHFVIMIDQRTHVMITTLQSHHP